MKKKLVTALAAFVFLGTSCKKDVTCECTTTTSSTSTYVDEQGTSYTNVEPSKVSTTTKDYKKVKKSNLKTICGDTKGNYTSTSSGPNYTSTGYETSETKCKIK